MNADETLEEELKRKMDEACLIGPGKTIRVSPLQPGTWQRRQALEKEYAAKIAERDRKATK